mgnify:CR=1 FL=1
MTTDNPWQVESIQDFSFLKCPECIFDTKTEDTFRNHATENHPLSLVLFREPLKYDPILVKHEIFDLIKNEEESYDPLTIEGHEDDISEDQKPDPTEKFKDGDSSGKDVHQGKRPFKCGICGYATALNHKLVKHIQTVHKKGKNRDCEYCGKSFVSHSALRKHLKLAHKLKKSEFISYKKEGGNNLISPLDYLETSFDKVESSQSDSLIEEHHSELSNVKLEIIEEEEENHKISQYDKFENDIGSDFEENRPFEDDLTSHIKKPYEKIKCEICKTYEFSTENDLYAHMLLDHKGLKAKKHYGKKWSSGYTLKDHEKENKFKCLLCALCFSEQCLLENHVKLAHVDKKCESDTICSICDIDFQQESGLKRHFDKCHSENSVQCPSCDKSFSQKYTLDKHIQSAHELKKCSLCDASFKKAIGLKRHITTVHEETGIMCNICEKPFTSRNLKRHIEEVHEKKIAGRCPMCDKGFSQIHSLQRHIESVHEGRKYMCSLCGLELSGSAGLRKHNLTVHERKRSHMCTICGKDFSQGPHLKRHTEAVHEKKQHSCPICENKFSDSSNLKAHIKTVHEGIKPRVRKPKE